MKRRWLLSIFALSLALGAARTAAAGDPRELKAREDFGMGRYQEALETYAKLYAETVHPTYLRNIGRCYQNLGQPDKAISAFREYLRKQKTITPEERTEVEGFIAEMQELKKQQASDGSATTRQPPPKSTITTLARAPEPESGSTKPAVLVSAPAAPPSDESSPVYTRWWFWTIVGAAAVGAGLAVAGATGAFTKTQDAGCPPMTTCLR